MKKICVLSLCLILCGCSCSTTKPASTATPTPMASMTPTPTTETAVRGTKDYLDYLSGSYTLTNPNPIDNLDGNALEGYTFGYSNADFYLLRFDRSNDTASSWLNEAMEKGYIEVKINDTLKKYYALVNQDYMLLYDTENLEAGFREHFQNYEMNSSGTNTNQ